MLQSDIFHESAQKFDLGIAKDEGLIAYNLRHFYMGIGAICTLLGACRAYTFTFEVEHIYEDALDSKFFQYVKS